MCVLCVFLFACHYFAGCRLRGFSERIPLDSGIVSSGTLALVCRSPIGNIIVSPIGNLTDVLISVKFHVLGQREDFPQCISSGTLALVYRSPIGNVVVRPIGNLNNIFRVLQNTFMSHIGFPHVSCVGVHEDFFFCILSGTEWKRPIGCLKLQVILRKRANNYRILWREITYKDKASYGSSPLCTLALVCRSPLDNLTVILISCKSYRVAKTHRIPYLYRSFSAKVTYI